MSIYSETDSSFKPTYLYIKQHTVTGKLYFGKTINNPEKYPGSGLHWSRHIKKHGKEYVVTLWWCLFYDKNSIKEFALMFSDHENIVESNNWLNKKPENGLDGNVVGNFHKPESIKLMRDAKLGKKASIKTKLLLKELRKGVGNSMYGKFHSKHSIEKMSENRKGRSSWNKGKSHSIETLEKIKIAAMNRNPVSDKTKAKLKRRVQCPHCGKISNISNMTRWHFDNCKSKQ